MTLGKNILCLRKKKGLSQEELGEKINVTRQTISNWELDSTAPNPEQLKQLSKVLNISVDELIGNDVYIDKQKSYRNEYEYVSKIKIKGIPFVHINIGRSFRKARGIIAIGNIAQGVIAIGGMAIGIFSFGGLSLGLLSLGGLAIGILLSLGGISIGSFAIGGIALGLFSIGGLSIGLYSIGGYSIAKYVASGDYAKGYIAIGNHVRGTVELIQSQSTSNEIKEIILEEFPRTWKFIVEIISNVSFH